MEIGNSIYRVIIEDQKGQNGVGTYTVKTGPNHPAGPDLNVLYDGLNSYNTIRSTTSTTDYIQINSTPSSTFRVVHLDDYGTVQTIGATGVRITYTLPGSPTTPDLFTIISEINVLGSTINDSSVEIRTTITNTGNTPLQIGVRYFWDYMIADDDGPTFQALNPDGPVLTTEIDYNNPNFSQYRVVDNDVSPHPPTYFVYGFIKNQRNSTPVTDIKYTEYEKAFDSAFDVDVDTTSDIATLNRGANDSSVSIYFGSNGNYIQLAPNQTIQAAASLGLSSPKTSDLSITGNSIPTEMEIGQPLVFNFTALNNGPDEEANAAVIDTLPNNVTFVSASCSQGSYTQSGKKVNFSLGALANGASANLSIKVIPSEGKLSNTATISGDNADPDYSNNTFSQNTTVFNYSRGVKFSV